MATGSTMRFLHHARKGPHMDSTIKQLQPGLFPVSLKPSGLLCEYAENPVGLDVRIPRFSWKAHCDERGQSQSAYRIIIADDLTKLDDNMGSIWDSGKVATDKSMNIAYGGLPLSSRGIYWWKVCIWDKDDRESQYSDSAVFEMGLLDKSDWKADWVGFPGGKCGESLIFRKRFKLEKPVTKARAYISGLGYSELHINGQKVGDHVLDPGCTDYSKRVLYITYDITRYLLPGSNALGIMVGNGWYASTALLYQMEIEYADGTTNCHTPAAHGSGWFVTTGPISRNSIYDGEIYDAQKEKSGWDTTDFDDEPSSLRKHGWTAPYMIGGPGGELVSQSIEPIRVVSHRKPLKVSSPKEGVHVFDMGQNMVGWVKLIVNGEKGAEIVLKYAENLYEDGFVNQENLRTALSRDIYILKGVETEFYEPRFTYHGFRYVQIDGFPGVPTLETVTGCIVRSDVEKTGEFNCSDALVNRIHENVVWTESGNLHSIPTDCPQRDERQGWLNDATVRAEESIYNFGMARLFSKWVDDIEDTQDEFGAITDTAPFKWGKRPADPVSSSYLIIPWLVYLHYGDERILERHYCGMKKWNAFLGTKADQYIVNYSYYGDWASPKNEAIEGSQGDGAVSAATSGLLMSTGYYYLNAALLSKIARILHHDKDEKKFTKLAMKIKHAFHEKFFDTKTFMYAKGSQASNVFPIYLGIVPDPFKKAVMENILKDVVENRDCHLSTGNLCTKYMLEQLVEEGYADLAYQLVTQKTYPSWGYMISQGATTIWERWEYATGGAMNSHNHPMFASVGSWFYKYLAGIQVDERNPGFGRFTIRPVLPQGLHSVKASLKTMKGMIESGWEKNGETVDFHITIPFNSRADVYIPIRDYLDGTVFLYEGETMIWNGSPLVIHLQGLRNVRLSDASIALEAGSGIYHLKCTHCHNLNEVPYI